jgi:hypothetical protein
VTSLLRSKGGSGFADHQARRAVISQEIGSEKRQDFAVQRLDEQTLVFELDDASEEQGEFEEFTFKSVAISQLAPNVSIGRHGNMSMNLATKKLLGDVDRVILLYNETERLIGLRPATAEERHAKPLRQSATQRTWALSAEGFLKRFQILHDSGRSYEPRPIEGMVVIDLSSPKPPRLLRTRTGGITTE